MADQASIDKDLFQHCDLVRMQRTQFAETSSTGAATLQRGKNRFAGHTLDKSIHLYRMWFFLVKVVYDCEESGLKFGAQKQHSVKLSKRFYKHWDIENYIGKSFDEFFREKIHLFGDEGVVVVDEIDASNDHIYLKVRKHSKTEDVVRDVRDLLKNTTSQSGVEYQIQRQHKYFYLHQQYNVFLMRQSGWKTRQVKEWLDASYGRYRARVASSNAAMRKLYRQSEQIILDVARGHF